MLASSAYMLGRDRDYLDAWELAYHSHLSAGEPARAAHCTWWIGDYRRFRGDSARATGWFARGHRLLDQVEEDCVARGYLLMPTLHNHVSAGEHEAASAVAVAAGEIGERFDDRDLIALARMEQGHALVRQGCVAEGLRLVDETMVAVTTEDLSPVIAGIEGELRMWAGDAEIRIGAGQSLLAPKGVPHTYRVESPGGARWLVVTTRGDFERFVRELSRPAERPGLPAPQGPPTPEQEDALAEAARQHGIELVGPPLAA